MNSVSTFLKDYFIKYTAINSQSNYSVTTLPSSPGQMKLAEQLKEDLEHFGISNIELQNNAILIAKIPATRPSAPAILFMSHTDTVDIGENPGVKAQVLDFEGKDLVLNQEKNIIFKISEHEEIMNYNNEPIIFSDGTSVLGADDKAGVTVMMAIAHYLSNHKMDHGDIYLVFVPDEEVGLRGSYALDLSKVPVKYSYTIDGGPVGELGCETFNGASATIHIQGVSIHPGAAKNIMVNPILVANDLIAQFDRFDTPEHSEGKEGFFLIHDITGNASSSEIRMIIRDFDLESFNKRKQKVLEIIEKTKTLHPKALIACDIEDSYANIANNMSTDRSYIDLPINAMKNLGIEVHIDPVRGGTDGSVLSSKGLPTPNIFTGAHAIHSIYEYLPISSLTKSFEVVLEMIRLSSQEG